MSTKSRLLAVLSGEVVEPPPVWIMRQAGRYLPEYRELRKKAGSFLDLCLTPSFAAEATLQPIRRFDFDAAILFADILIVPKALGQDVTFEEGEGPRLASLEVYPELVRPAFDAEIAPVLETVARVRRELPPEKALIGFCGAPWTVATYMIAGRGTLEQLPARRLALEDPEKLQRLIEVLVEASARYLLGQIAAGADVIKIFDTWAGVLDEAGFERWAVKPVRAIVDKVRAVRPDARIIAFPRGAGVRLAGYADRTGVDAVAVDWMTPLSAARSWLPHRVALQGNLDPLRLVAGGPSLEEGIDAVLSAMRGRPHIFNLGHGITPDTPIENVVRLVARVRGGQA